MWQERRDAYVGGQRPEARRIPVADAGHHEHVLVGQAPDGGQHQVVEVGRDGTLRHVYHRPVVGLHLRPPGRQVAACTGVRERADEVHLPGQVPARVLELRHPVLQMQRRRDGCHQRAGPGRQPDPRPYRPVVRAHVT